MIKVQFITDQLVPLTEEEKSKYNIFEVPNPLSIDGKEYIDNQLPFSIEKFCELLLDEDKTMETSQPPPVAYEELFKKIPPELPIYIFCMSSNIAGFYKSATSAKSNFPERDINIIDTLSVPPLPLLGVFTAAKFAENASSLEDLKKQIEGITSRMGIYWALYSLKYLYVSGRINAAQAFFGKMIKLVPLITTDKSGLIIPAGKTRRIAKSISRICELVERDIEQKGGTAVDLIISYTGSEENGLLLKETAEKRLPVKNLFFRKGSYSVHRYIGPDGAGIGYYIHS